MRRPTQRENMRPWQGPRRWRVRSKNFAPSRLCGFSFDVHDTAAARDRRPSLDAVRTSVLVVDGAMGSQLYERGVLYGTNCFEQLNVSRPEIVAKVHEDFVRAGASVIETNTFGANAR